jgi:hypothetical protein
MTFTKLFSSITESTIWCENDQVRLVWITMLAMANRNGFVFGSAPGLANRARVPIESVREALAKFQQPDFDSRTKEHEGRRIEEVDGGWRLLSYAKHRAIRDEEDRREYMRELMREKRSKEKLAPVNPVSQCKPPLSQAEAEAEAVNKTPSVTEESFTLDAAVSYVLVETGWAGKRLRDVVHEVIYRELKKVGVLPKDAADAIIAAWRKYDPLEMPFKQGAETFLSTGTWRKSEKTWRNGKGPAQTPAGYESQSVIRKRELEQRKAQGL